MHTITQAARHISAGDIAAAAILILPLAALAVWSGYLAGAL